MKGERDEGTLRLAARDTGGFIKSAFEALEIVSKREDVALAGALAAMMHLGFEHRRTFDLDLVVSDPRSVAEDLRPLSPRFEGSLRQRYILPGGLAIDLLSVEEEEGAPVPPVPARLARQALEFALEGARRMRCVVVDENGREQYGAEVRVVSPGALLALKAAELVERRGANADEAGADAYDIVVFVNDAELKRRCLNDLRNSPGDLKVLVAEAIRQAFVESRIVTAAALRLSQRVQYVVAPSEITSMGRALAQEILETGGNEN